MSEIEQHDTVVIKRIDGTDFVGVALKEPGNVYVMYRLQEDFRVNCAPFVANVLQGYDIIAWFKAGTEGAIK